MKSFDLDHSGLSEAQFKLFQELVMSETGLYFSDSRRHQLSLGLDVRLEETGLGSYEDYYRYLKFQLAGHSNTRRLEIQHLIDELTIQETHFFRNGPQFRVLKSHIIPEFVKRRGSGKRILRIWSAGCSTGQEPYSIAMILMETLPDPESWDVSLLATDINLQGLMIAKSGLYDQKACEPVPKDYLSKYFEKKGNEFAVSDRIKKLVTFDTHNLVTDPYNHAAMAALDIIFCRNVTIYFTLETTKKVIEKFHAKLSPPGYLFLGHSESLWRLSDKFAPVEFPGAFVYFKDAPPSARIPRSADSAGPSGSRPAMKADPIAFSNIQWLPDVSSGGGAAKRASGDSAFSEAVERVKKKDYEKAVPLLRAIGASDPNHTQARLLLATIHSNRGEDQEAIRLLEEVIRKDTLLENAYCLLGTLYRRGGDRDRAAAMFHRTLYVNPTNPIASYQLAEIFLRSGEVAKARKAYQNTLRSLKEYSGAEDIPMADDLTVNLLSQICQREIDVIDHS